MSGAEGWSKDQCTMCGCGREALAFMELLVEIFGRVGNGKGDC